MATITTINSGDNITDSRSVINTNFANLNNDKIETSVLDTDTTLAANSDSKIATQKAVKAYIDSGGTGGTTETISPTLGNTMWTTQYASGSADSVNPNFSSDIAAFGFGADHSLTLVTLEAGQEKIETRDMTTDWAAMDEITSACVVGSYLYALLRDNTTNPDTYAVYRFSKSNMAAGGTLMTSSGAKLLVNANTASDMRMTSDGTYIYFNFEAGNDTTNDYKIAKYSISGTDLVYVSTTNLGSSAGVVNYFCVKG